MDRVWGLVLLEGKKEFFSGLAPEHAFREAKEG